MNNQRRKDIAKATELVNGFEERLSALLSDVEAAREAVSALADEENEYKENMPEGLQNGEKGEQADAAISALEDVRDKLQELEDAISDIDTSDLVGKLEEAAA